MLKVASAYFKEKDSLVTMGLFGTSGKIAKEGAGLFTGPKPLLCREAMEPVIIETDKSLTTACITAYTSSPPSCVRNAD